MQNVPKFVSNFLTRCFFYCRWRILNSGRKARSPFANAYWFGKRLFKLLPYLHFIYWFACSSKYSARLLIVWILVAHPSDKFFFQLLYGALFCRTKCSVTNFRQFFIQSEFDVMQKLSEISLRAYTLRF